MTLDDHFFRQEFGRLVALLTRRVGVQHLELVEDAVQLALLAAVESWGRGAQPDNPPAWLHRVAHNHLMDELRRRARRARIEETLPVGPAESPQPEISVSDAVRDDLLLMMFVCCDGSIPLESQLVLALRTLCGFDVREIADRLFMSEANVYKRLQRARTRLRDAPLDLDGLDPAQLVARLPAVHGIVYTLFTEGYLSSSASAESAIRHELCAEARRLAGVLAAHPPTATPETFALLALMCLHDARRSARQDDLGGLILLEEQDRSRWSQPDIAEGLGWLARSAEGATFSRYHAEAGIAAEHVLAPSLATTRWDHIVECYELLDRVAPSALHTLNRALALAELRGPEAGLALLAGLAPPTWLEGSYLWFAALADLHRRCGHTELAATHAAAAHAAAPSDTIRAALRRRLRARGN
jgi:RNA polymerase sigma-70 factor (ECF subfamily)